MRIPTIVLSLALVAAPLTAAPANKAPVKQPASAPSGHREVLPFIADDFPRALSRARSLNVPLVVETWAPW